MPRKIELINVDSKIPNLALMKISAWHKLQGDQIEWEFPLFQSDITNASCLYENHAGLIPVGAIKGGVGIDPKISLPIKIEKMKPDYSLYPNIDYSLGYTYRHCPRRCPWCVVWKMEINKDKSHHSIWEFHDSHFKKIMLLDNNLFADPQWKVTFEEIWDANLRVIEHGFDIRLLDEEKAEALKRTGFVGQIHFAFDQPEYESTIRRGVALLRKAGLNLNRITFYVLCGFNTTPRQDIDRVRILRELKVCAFVMKHQNGWKELHDFAFLVNTPRYYKRIDWKEYPEWNNKTERRGRDREKENLPKMWTTNEER